MKIYLKKFGTTLISRQAGREASAAFLPSLKDVGPEEKLEVDFEGVLTFSPSWGAEFLDPLSRRFGDRLVLMYTDNPSVKATIELLESINQKKFTVAT